MDRKKSLLNVFVSVGFKIVTMVLSIVVKRFLIQSCGNEVNGLNALYLSIIGFLAVAELGVGTAITFCMYQPIVRGETDKVAALYHLFRRIYTVVGLFILVGGIAITPFLHYFAKDYTQIEVNLQSTFVLMLLSVVATYFFGAKTALINAYKNNYITTAINSGGIVLQNVLQIIVLLKTQSFEGYLVCRIVSVLMQWLITEIIAQKKYSGLTKNRQKIDKETRIEVIKNIKAMFMHKIGSLLVNTFDSMIISIFVGVVALGAYSNYLTILNAMAGVIGLVFTSLTSSFGHLYAEKEKGAAREFCEAFSILNFLIGTVFYLGYYAVIDNLITILFSGDLVVSKSISYIITLNGFVRYMRSNVLTFRDATGTFYNDRWKPLIEGIVNIVLSILLVKKIGMVGVVAATLITNLFICHVMEPLVLYKYAFEASPKGYYFINYGMILLFSAATLLLDRLLWSCTNQWMELLINGSISLIVSLPVCLIGLSFGAKQLKTVFHFTKEK